MTDKLQPTLRSAYPHFAAISTRWKDNDVYGHVNNVVYFEFFDTAINQFLIELGALDIERSEVVGLVVDNRCTYFSSIRFPDTVQVGIKITRIGRSSVEYEVGVFKNADESAAALGRFVHVYVDKATGSATEIPENIRSVLQTIYRPTA
ncbi:MULTISPECIES: thioesterase family protein [unclassified Bordetella]|uniref:acyl-CoA thioesterase n=1 Tax=unclassified Bordetella TaxID=2630031 RepID=UPI0013237667|nr:MULTISPECIES: thioesterase family protein [unclassified Bordetella]MVW72011.1 acyl-CoA thioesterase [Bordetella sp. 15P40C-2]MVW79267.1 acyl-CoA thioesterase [Bordetella sp. 02P26C-1]